VPTIGASGAIAATLGAYLVLFPRARVTTLVFLGFFYQLIDIPAIVVLGFWFVLQLIDGLASLGPVQAGGGAWGGNAVGRLARKTKVPKPRSTAARRLCPRSRRTPPGCREDDCQHEQKPRNSATRRFAIPLASSVHDA